MPEEQVANPDGCGKCGYCLEDCVCDFRRVVTPFIRPGNLEISSIKKMKAAAEKFEGQELVCVQVVGQDGGAWYMSASMGLIPGTNKVVLTISHPNLLKLPDLVPGEHWAE